MSPTPRRWFVWCALLAALLCTCARGDEPVEAHTAATTSCAGAPATPTRFLRQLSMDLRGAPPTVAEYRRVLAAGDVPPEMIDEMLQDPRFIERVKRWHRDLLWPNLGGFEMDLGARLAVVPAPGQELGAEYINPEWLLEAMERRSDEATCPPAGTVAHLTAASCCTPANPDHPACCRVRNARYNPDDAACVARSAALPAVFNYGVSVGDRDLRGGDSYLGCADVPYPPARVAADDRRWPHDANGRPYYASPKNGARRFYYDDRDVPLPYHSFATCPNYCRALRLTGPNNTPARVDYVAKSRTVMGRTEYGDGPGFACPAGYAEVENPCDNASETRLQSRVELRREGWVLARPYWTDGRWVKTCAYEAQTRTESVTRRATCRMRTLLDASCGCGPDGAWCAPFTGEALRPSRTVSQVVRALNQEPLEIIASVVARDEDYATIFTTRRGMANGVLAYANRYQVEQMGELDFTASAPPESLPDVPRSDPTWRAYVRAPQHSGVLTTPVYLARFPTLRARINRFRTTFLCRPFVPSSDPPAPPESSCHAEANLARRCGCQYCHATIEPLGAAWGRWAERSTRYLDPARFPSFDPACAGCSGNACPERCRVYVTAPLDGDSLRFLGTFAPYLYRSPEEIRRIEEGPRSLITDALASQELQACAAQTAWARLLNRPMSEAERTRALPSLVRDFEASGRSYRALVRAVVTSPAYRRVD